MRNGILRVITVIVTLIALIILGGYIYLKNSPYWNAVTVYSDNYRAERFRTMDLVMPSNNKIRRSEAVWELEENLKELPKTYTFNGKEYDTMEFLKRTETTGLAILYDQKIVFEEYYQGYDENSKATSWSIAKSFLSAMVGIAINDGLIDSVNDPITDYITSLKNTAYDGIPIKHILTMSSGVFFDENYDSYTSDVSMIFIRNFAFSEPMSDYITRLEKVRESGVYNDYITSDSLVLGMLIREVTGKSVSAYLEETIWIPMGAEQDAFWMLDSAGQEISFGFLNAVLRDYLRFGNLYLLNGYRDETSIIPSDWVDESLAIHGSHLEPGDNPNSSWTFGYGYQWWLPEEPEGDYTAIGIWGQYIYVHPKYNVVVVKTSTDKKFDDNDHESIAFFRTLARHFANQ